MSRQTDDNLINWNQTGFSDGLVKNAPHEDIPPEAVAGLVNAHSFRKEIQPRLASWLWSELQPPAWKKDCSDAYSGYTMSKTDDIVTCTEAIFTQEFVSYFIAFPVDDGYYHDEITEYISTRQVRVSLSGTIDPTSGCYIHGRLNINSWHRRKRKKVWQWAQRIYTSPISYSRFDECLCVSRRAPSNVVSAWDQKDDYGLIGNSNGIFKLSFDDVVGILWRANGPVPTELLTGRQRRRNYNYRYDYLYSMCRLSGNGLRDRTTTKILQQSGTTRLNLNISPPKDYATYWTEKPIGDDRDNTGCSLTCGRVSDAYKDPYYYRTIAAPGASFKFTHNENEAEFLVDMSTTGTNVQNMAEVAKSIKGAINTLFPWIDVKWEDNDHMLFTTGEEKNATISYLGTGDNGTDIAAILQGTEGNATLDEEWACRSPNKVGTYYIPKDQGYYEWHWNHYTKWRTTDIGENGADPRTTINGEELSPLKFTWAGDFRVAGAFWAYKENNIIIAEIGTFEKADEGTPYEWEDGEVDTLSEYISPTRMRVETDYYYAGADKELQAGVIGGGRVLRASQNGHIVTLETELNDDYLSKDSCDERKTVYWSNGYTSIVLKVLSSTSFRVHDDAVRTTQGITLDPTCRVISDIVTDEMLRARMDEKHTGLLNMRFKDAMPNCNILSIVPGFMLTAKRGDSIIPYCDLANNQEYNLGYHLPNRQIIDKIEGAIQLIKKAPNFFLVWCSDTLWGGPTNNPSIETLPEFGEWYGILHADIVDGYLGAVDWGSIEEVDYGIFELICQDMSVRQLVNKKYGEDYTFNNDQQDIIAKDLKETWNVGTSAYGRTLGHVFWRTLK